MMRTELASYRVWTVGESIILMEDLQTLKNWIEHCQRDTDCRRIRAKFAERLTQQYSVLEDFTARYKESFDCNTTVAAFLSYALCCLVDDIVTNYDKEFFAEKVKQ